MSRLFLPKIPPEEAVSEYSLSKNFNRIVKSHPKFDVVGQNDPKAYLAFLKMRLLDAESKIKKNKKNSKNIRKELDTQWEELHQKENSLRENFEHFDKFVRGNMEKRERANRKIQEDLKMTKQRQAEIEQLKELIEDVSHDKRKMDKLIKDYSLYENFLEQVVHKTEFNNISDIIQRYLSLLNARETLSERQEENFRTMDTARSEMMKLMEEKNFIIMGLNNQIANLQARFENATIRALEGEQLVIQIKNNAVKQMNEIDATKVSVWNIFQHMTLSKNHPIKIKKENIEEQMMYIKRTLTELARVNKILNKKSRPVPRISDKK